MIYKRSISAFFTGILFLLFPFSIYAQCDKEHFNGCVSGKAFALFEPAVVELSLFVVETSENKQFVFPFIGFGNLSHQFMIQAELQRPANKVVISLEKNGKPLFSDTTVVKQLHKLPETGLYYLCFDFSSAPQHCFRGGIGYRIYDKRKLIPDDFTEELLRLQPLLLKYRNTLRVDFSGQEVIIEGVADKNDQMQIAALMEKAARLNQAIQQTLEELQKD